MSGRRKVKPVVEEPVRMTSEAYRETANMIGIVGSCVETLDLTGMLNLIQDVDTIAPLLDPTAWQKGHQNTDAMRELAAPLLRFQEAYKRVKAEFK